ncbi:uncharacterized protein (DUF1800 family) [Rhabdobacter roseus]|uniref:Uncharacterized protein (DUF1800 family) n=1 Tax=Rhabdobacter roseus TaxID=1655419 RepID=A0A840TS12_9BACT|nr:hypothetical protein [Rhabdobacter roseus]MBB5286094.1 uncharacterized protein (DUF1800 family) [Rhabdobacter roseus]
MKSNRRSIIFAVVFGVVLGLIPGTGTSQAKNEDVKAPTRALVKGTEKQFAAYIKSEFPVFAQNENWEVIEKMVTLYNEKPSALTKIKVQEQQVFNAAIADLNTQLKGRNTLEAQQWQLNLDKTAQAIRFVWNFDFNSLTPIVTEVLPMPGLAAESNL